ncbi:hypothetical protein HK101_011764 [Irineochytrium annulatum]|nr:hypothetical protein HK101_011764 [Irineochytrium annulatum]
MVIDCGQAMAKFYLKYETVKGIVYISDSLLIVKGIVELKLECVAKGHELLEVKFRSDKTHLNNLNKSVKFPLMGKVKDSADKANILIQAVAKGSKRAESIDFDEAWGDDDIDLACLDEIEKAFDKSSPAPELSRGVSAKGGRKTRASTDQDFDQEDEIVCKGDTPKRKKGSMRGILAKTARKRKNRKGQLLKEVQNVDSRMAEGDPNKELSETPDMQSPETTHTRDSSPELGHEFIKVRRPKKRLQIKPLVSDANRTTASYNVSSDNDSDLLDARDAAKVVNKPAPETSTLREDTDRPVAVRLPTSELVADDGVSPLFSPDDVVMEKELEVTSKRGRKFHLLIIS